MRGRGFIYGVVGAIALLSACSPVPDGILSQKDMGYADSRRNNQLR